MICLYCLFNIFLLFNVYFSSLLPEYLISISFHLLMAAFHLLLSNFSHPNSFLHVLYHKIGWYIISTPMFNFTIILTGRYYYCTSVTKEAIWFIQDHQSPPQKKNEPRFKHTFRCKLMGFSDRWILELVKWSHCNI